MSPNLVYLASLTLEFVGREGVVKPLLDAREVRRYVVPPVELADGRHVFALGQICHVVAELEGKVLHDVCTRLAV